MDGAEQVSRTLRGIAQDLNTIPSGARQGVEAINANITSIVSSIQSLSKAMSGMSGLDPALEKAFGTGKARLLREFSTEIERMEKQVENLTKKTDDYNRMAERARGRGLNLAASRLESSAVESGMQAQATRDQINMLKSELPKPPVPEPYRVPGSNFIESAFRQMGMPGMAGNAAWATLAALATGMQGAFSTTGQISREIAERRYLTAGGRQALGGDPLLNALRAAGMNEAEQEVYSGNGLSFFGTQVRLVGRQIRGLMTGKDPRQVQTELAEERAQLDKERFGALNDVVGLRGEIGERLNVAERQFGQAGVRAGLGSLMGGPVDRELAMSLVERMQAFGALPTGAQRGLAILPTRYGTSDDLLRELARREARAIRGGQGGADQAGAFQDVVGAAGASTQSSQSVVADFLGRRAGQLDPLGTMSIDQFGGGIAGAMQAGFLAAPRANEGDRAAIVANEASSVEGRLRTPFDPMRTLAKAALINQGLTNVEAELVLRMGVNESKAKVNEILSKRTGKSVDIGRVLSRTAGGLTGAVSGLLEEQMSPDFRDAFPRAGARLATGAATAEEAGVRQAAQEGYFQGADVTGGRAAATPGQQTTQDVQRAERAKLDMELINQLRRIGQFLETNVGRNTDRIIDAVKEAGDAFTGKMGSYSGPRR